jgi:hypothetical protein
MYEAVVRCINTLSEVKIDEKQSILVKHDQSTEVYTFTLVDENVGPDELFSVTYAGSSVTDSKIYILCYAARTQLVMNLIDRNEFDYIFDLECSYELSVVGDDGNITVEAVQRVNNPFTIVSADQYLDSSCAICCEEFMTEENSVCITECNHIYHVKCINVWLRQKNTCPLCRCELS